MLSPFSSKGATTGRLYDLARNMDSHVRILIPKADKYGVSGADELFFFTIGKKSFLLLPLHTYRVVKYLLRERPNVVYFAKPHFFTFLPALLYKIMRPSCTLAFDCDEWDPATLRDNEDSFYKVWLTDFLAYLSMRLSDKVVYSNTWIKEEKIPKKYWGKCLYLSNGVDTSQFRAVRKRKSKEFSLMFVGLLHKIKHILPIVEALKIASKEIPNLKCYIVGDGPRRKELEGIIAVNGLEKFFVFTGTVPHEKLPQLLPTVDVLIAPFSNLEGVRYQSNVKIFEYMATGVPIIATDVGDIKKVLGDGRAAYIVAPDNPMSIAEQLVKIYKNPEESKLRTSLARKLAVEKYDWRVLAEKLSAFLS
jgi:glycosyltransferase involved in cell wall biosynthesis